MSSPETGSRKGGDERNLTIIVVPHDELDTRSFVISYGKLRVLTVVGVAAILMFAIALAFFFPMLAQATRARSMQRELEQLQSERARVVELARQLAEVEEQYERVRKMLGADALGDDSTSLLPPLRTDTSAATDADSNDAAAVIDLWPLSARGFITRTVNDGRSNHTGLDIAVPSASYIRAAGPGRVRVAGVDSVYGQYIVIDHGGGLESVYGHASKLFVTAGDRVRRAEVIGLTGSTGRSTAPHLHFEIRQGGQAVDPLAFVRQP